jgi:hypothetical protein
LRQNELGERQDFRKYAKNGFIWLEMCPNWRNYIAFRAKLMFVRDIILCNISQSKFIGGLGHKIFGY